MAAAFEVETQKPTWSHCECCGSFNVRVTGFVHQHDDTVAVYFAAYANAHDTDLLMLVSVGPWGEDAEAAERAAFLCHVRPTDGTYQVMLGDAMASTWRDAPTMGQMLTRPLALQHPAKGTAFAVLDAAIAADPVLSGFIHRVHCGDANEPLEMNFGAPDDVFAVGLDSPRVKAGKSFVALDGKRFFVRCLLPMAVESYGTWSVGLWIEVTQADWEVARRVWDKPAEYAALTFCGTVANDVQAKLALPVNLGAEVELHVDHTEEPPKVKSPRKGALAKRMTTVWAKSAFEAYAIPRGFL